MAGTPAGGRKTAAVIKQRYGEDFYSKIGVKGGAAARQSFIRQWPGTGRLGRRLRGGSSND